MDSTATAGVDLAHLPDRPPDRSTCRVLEGRTQGEGRATIAEFEGSADSQAGPHIHRAGQFYRHAVRASGRPDVPASGVQHGVWRSWPFARAGPALRSGPGLFSPDVRPTAEAPVDDRPGLAGFQHPKVVVDDLTVSPQHFAPAGARRRDEAAACIGSKNKCHVRGLRLNESQTGVARVELRQCDRRLRGTSPIWKTGHFGIASGVTHRIARHNFAVMCPEPTASAVPRSGACGEVRGDVQLIRQNLHGRGPPVTFT